MPGIYFHIPFCKQACHYCNFHFSTSLKQKEELIAALCTELTITKSFVNQDDAVNTIYFGGGTPSLLTGDEIKKLLNAVYQNYPVEINAEITPEANPDDISETSLKEWKSAGINRFSLGIQSFRDEDLSWMNRAHNAKQGLRSIEMIRDAGFDNFSIDLIYGSPTLSDDDWKENVDTAISLEIPHLSTYALTVEPRTALQKMIELKKKEDVDTEKQASQFLSLMTWLRQAGYEHYEISNFAKPGFRSRHNSSY